MQMTLYYWASIGYGTVSRMLPGLKSFAQAVSCVCFLQLMFVGCLRQTHITTWLLWYCPVQIPFYGQVCLGISWLHPSWFLSCSVPWRNSSTWKAPRPQFYWSVRCTTQTQRLAATAGTGQKFQGLTFIFHHVGGTGFCVYAGFRYPHGHKVVSASEQAAGTVGPKGVADKVGCWSMLCGLSGKER